MLRRLAIATLFLGLLVAAPALARHRPRHSRSHRSAPVRATTTTTGQSGFVTVSSATATEAVVAGLPLDTHQVPVTVSTSKPLHVDDTGGTIYATTALCGSRHGCTGTISGGAYDTAPPSFIHAGDTLLMELSVTQDVVTAALGSGARVPSVVIYDFG